MPLAYAFRALPATVDARPGPGEVMFRAHVEDHGAGTGTRRMQVALDLLRLGEQALLRGPGASERLVLLVDPTRPVLDDMLAALLVRHGWQQPGFAELARYAAIVRQGYPVTGVLPERSLEGVFQAIRNRDGLAAQSLDEPRAAARFLAHWRRLEQRLLACAAVGRNPFREHLCDDPAFAEERAFLAADRAVFQRDVARGQRWRTALPGWTGGSSALILIEPESLLFKHWSRYGSSARFPFLAVRWKPGHWVFSTDPLEAISLLPLCQRLQQAEELSAPPSGAADPWFDGARFEHTLIASPKRGSGIPDDELLRRVREWLRARPLTGTEGAPTDAFVELWPFPALTRPRHSYWCGRHPVFEAELDGERVDVLVQGLDDADILLRRDIALARKDLAKLQERLAAHIHPDQARVRFCRRIESALWIGRDLAGLIFPHAAQGSLAVWRAAVRRVRALDLLHLARDIARGLAFLHALDIDDLGLTPADIVLDIEDDTLRAAIQHSGTDRAWPSAGGSAETGKVRDLRAFAGLLLFAIGGEAVRLEREPDVAAAVTTAVEARHVRALTGGFVEGICALLTRLLTGTLPTAEDLVAALSALIPGEEAEEAPAEPAPAALDTLYTPAILSTDGPGKAAVGVHGLEGQTLHGWRLEEELGRGAMGIVYRATHTLLHTPAAVKILPPSCGANAEFKQRFVNEAMFLAHLDHPHLLKVNDLFEENGLLAIVSELAEGGSLHAALRARGPLPESEAAGYARQAALGLHAAAAQGIVHRDVKPANLLLTAAGMLKVADFGIARQRGLPGPTIAGSILGTPHYTSPEQCLATSAADHRSDLYSLGCTLYHLLTGAPPFRGRTAVEVLACHLHEPVPDVRAARPGLSPAIAALTARCMAKEPAGRFADGAALAQALAAWT